MFALHSPRPAPSLPTFAARESAAPQVLASPPLLTEAASASLTRYWPVSSGTQFYQMASAPQGGVFTFSRGLPGSSPAGITYAEERVATTSNTGLPSSLAQQWSFIHEGERIELQIRSNPHGFLIRIDDHFVSLDPYQSSGQIVLLLEFGVAARRRIDIISWGLGFAGVYTDPQDCIFAAEQRGPRTVVFGDSFTTPEPINWVNWFAHDMGWDDVWPSGVGGTGFVADALGNAPSLPERVASDIAPYSPDVVYIHAGLNDLSSPASQVELNAALTVRRIREHCPEAMIVGGTNTAFGIESWDAQALDVMDAIRSGLEGEGAGYISPLELPLSFGGQQIGIEAALYAPVTAGQAGNEGTPTSVSYPNGFTCTTAVDTPLANLRVGSVVEIGVGATRERVAITATGFYNARLVYGFDGAMQYDHSAGEPVREVGPSFVTGQGTTLNPSGWGCADRYVGLDSFHYSAEGHRALGAVNASLLRHHLRGRPLI